MRLLVTDDVLLQRVIPTLSIVTVALQLLLCCCCQMIDVVGPKVVLKQGPSRSTTIPLFLERLQHHM